MSTKLNPATYSIVLWIIFSSRVAALPLVEKMCHNDNLYQVTQMVTHWLERCGSSSAIRGAMNQSGNSTEHIHESIKGNI